MLVQDIIELAKGGELRGLAVGNTVNPDTSVNTENVNTILGYINMAMIELYKRFPLNTEEYLFDRVTGTDFYQLPDGSANFLLADGVTPAPEFMWIVSAYGTIIRNNTQVLSDLAINEDENPYSVNLVSYNQVQVSIGIAAGQVSLIYVAAPKAYTIDDLATSINIPSQFIEPLLHYVGYRAHGAVNGNIQAENNTHYQRFELSCKEIKSQGMFSVQGTGMDTRLSNRGFV